jgi:hypothetical protein
VHGRRDRGEVIVRSTLGFLLHESVRACLIGSGDTEARGE